MGIRSVLKMLFAFFVLDFTGSFFYRVFFKFGGWGFVVRGFFGMLGGLMVDKYSLLWRGVFFGGIDF